MKSCLTLIAECVNGIINDAVRAEALCFGQQTQQRGNLQPDRSIRLLGENTAIISSIRHRVYSFVCLYNLS